MGWIVCPIRYSKSTMEGAATMPDWTLVANGIEYRQFTLPDPNNVFVARSRGSDWHLPGTQPF